MRAQVLGTRVQSLTAEWATNTNPRLISEPAGVELPSCQLNSDWGGALEASLTAWSRPVAQPLASVRYLRIQPKQLAGNDGAHSGSADVGGPVLGVTPASSEEDKGVSSASLLPSCAGRRDVSWTKVREATPGIFFWGDFHLFCGRAPSLSPLLSF